MAAGGFFRLTGPSAWPAPPSRFSFSSLREIEGCPRRWQYLHATWEGTVGIPRRANERAIVGTIAHGINERLFRELARRGLPAVGTPGYLEGLKEVAVHATVRTLIAEAEAEYRDHPRDAGFRLRASVRDVANDALRLFQGQYSRVARGSGSTQASSRVVGGGVGDGGADLVGLLRRRGVLAEVSVRHPRLPLVGQIDLVAEGAEGTTIVDFKTGVVKPEYRDQLRLYAMLWWRQTGDAPTRMEIAHVQGREGWIVSEQELARTEEAAAARIAQAVTTLEGGPAEARTGEECRHCPARAFCEDYWVSGHVKNAARDGEDAWIDVEITVVGQASAQGLTGLDGRGQAVEMVFEDETARRWGGFVVGERLRILGARAEDECVVRLLRSSEVFRK